MTANELLLGGKSGTITLSDSLSRVGSAKAAGSSAAAASLALSAPSHALSADQVELFNAWLVEQQSSWPPPAPPPGAPAPAPARSRSFAGVDLPA
eukprot:7388777-Prymnesium_polylepis.1